MCFYLLGMISNEYKKYFALSGYILKTIFSNIICFEYWFMQAHYIWTSLKKTKGRHIAVDVWGELNQASGQGTISLPKE